MRDIVQPPAKPAPTPVADLALPTSGRLLVSDADGLYVVTRSGKRTRLGRYDDASWSPNGLFVAASSGRALAALDPTNGAASAGRLRPGGQVSLPRWAPDGLHIAYRAGGALRIVYGNGEHDVLAGRDMAPVAPAWRPGTPRTVAWAATDGTVTVEDADTAKVLRTYRGGGVRQLAWSGDGRQLLIAGRRHGTIHDFATGRTTTRPRPRTGSCSPPPTAATGSRSPSAAPRAPRSASAAACSRRKAASTTSSGRPTAAGCSRPATSG